MYQYRSAEAFPRHIADAAEGTPLQQAADLLDRYPNLSEIELARLINLYRNLSALDSALLISDGELASKLDLFFADHRSKVRAPFRQYAALVGYAVIGVAVLAWSLIRL